MTPFKRNIPPLYRNFFQIRNLRVYCLFLVIYVKSFQTPVELQPPALVQQVEPVNGYFEAQFLLSFPMVQLILPYLLTTSPGKIFQSGTATIETQLIDKETKRQWTTDVRAQLKVNAV